MRNLVGLAIVTQLGFGVRAWAQTTPCPATPCPATPCPQADVTPPPCGCPCAAMPEREPLVRDLDDLPSPAELAARSDLWTTVAVGALFFGLGEAIAVGHFATSNEPGHVYDLVPIVGTTMVAFHGKSDSAWTSGLVFSTWLQAAGVIMAASAGAALAKLPVHIDGGVGPNGGSIELGMKF